MSRDYDDVHLPATTLEGREQQLSALAYDLAERQMREGTASAQVISHFLKAGSVRERLEHERLMKEVELMAEKAKNLASAANMERLYEEAINAMRTYSGQEPNNYGDGYEDPDVY